MNLKDILDGHISEHNCDECKVKDDCLILKVVSGKNPKDLFDLLDKITDKEKKTTDPIAVIKKKFRAMKEDKKKIFFSAYDLNHKLLQSMIEEAIDVRHNSKNNEFDIIINDKLLRKFHHGSVMPLLALLENKGLIKINF